MLKFSEANAKTKQLAKVRSLRPFLHGGRKIYSLDILSGWSCPYAKDCLSKVVIQDGKRKIKDGPDTEFRCFSASQEATYSNTYNRRKANYDFLQSKKDSMLKMFASLYSALPNNAGIVRIHVAGDFFNQLYFDAWVELARLRPDVLFYAYTKSLVYWIRREHSEENGIPENFILTASRGGRLDYMIEQHNLREAIVVFSTDEADRLNLEIDHDDSHAANPANRLNNFALLIHGIQPAGSDAAKALKELKGKGSYRR
jgi:hypothetical protein